jgi:hypothetical protein
MNLIYSCFSVEQQTVKTPVTIGHQDVMADVPCMVVQMVPEAGGDNSTIKLAVPGTETDYVVGKRYELTLQEV